MERSKSIASLVVGGINFEILTVGPESRKVSVLNLLMPMILVFYSSFNPKWALEMIKSNKSPKISSFLEMI